MTRRTEDEYFVGYALSRLSTRLGAPPHCLGAGSWKDAYRLFFSQMGAGRTADSFSNSLKNIRDAFDAHSTGSPRTGWQDESNLAAARNPETSVGRILAEWSGAKDADIAERMLSLIRGSDPVDIEGLARTEGGLKVQIVRRAERDLKLRSEAIAIHGTDCKGCGISFGESYGPWGDGYIEIHHMTPLGGGEARKTDPKTDLVPLCANCHRMVHLRPGICLSVEELKALLAHAASGSSDPY